ncbi:MAG TPA: twin transmembrane helix small protein [Devosia sp.]|nr:twin transmembrane helix small protein [Devosia sp.]
MNITAVVSIVAVAVVALILFAGLWNMFKGGEGSGNRSQMLMRARVIAQFVAIVVILGALYFFGRGGPPA